MTQNPSHKLLRALPSVDEVLRSEGLQTVLDRTPRWAVTEAVRLRIDELRRAILAGNVVAADDAPGPLAFPVAEVDALAAKLLAPKIRPVLNATGVVLHTNLGRAPLSPAALQQALHVAAGYSNLELDLETGLRGSRHGHLSALLRTLSGAEDAVVVNNNAAAVLLVATSLARGREVIVSRGELVEIGGEFRIPDVLAAGGAKLREVGTTNRTRIADYEAALGGETALLLKVHRSNFAMVGFTEEVSLPELVALAHSRNLPVAEDLGSGAMLRFADHRLFDEPMARTSIAAGADIVTISGDKLLGGPQAGLIAGRTDLIQRIRTNPLMRALRPDKLTLSVLEATLAFYRDGRAERDIPVVAMLVTPVSLLRSRAEELLGLCREACPDDPDLRAELRTSTARVGGGAQPLAELESVALVLQHARVAAQELAERLRQAPVPVLARVQEDAVWLDLRTLYDPQQHPLVAQGVRHALDRTRSSSL